MDSIVIPGQRIDGRPLRLAELKLTEFRLAKQVDSIETSGGTLHQFPTKVDVWIAVWERIGVAVPEWGIEDGVIRATVVFEDGTGRILSTSEVKYNPRGGR